MSEITPERIRQTRRRLRHSLSQFGQLLGYSKSYVSNLEHGHQPITDQFRAKFSAAVKTARKSKGPEYLSQMVYRDRKGRFTKRR